MKKPAQSANFVQVSCFRRETNRPPYIAPRREARLWLSEVIENYIDYVNKSDSYINHPAKFLSYFTVGVNLELL